MSQFLLKESEKKTTKKKKNKKKKKTVCFWHLYFLKFHEIESVRQYEKSDLKILFFCFSLDPEQNIFNTKIIDNNYPFGHLNNYLKTNSD